MFALREVTKAYAGRTALGPLSLELPAGRTTVLIGPSGCGKSTLLRLLIGLVVPDAGQVTFDGRPVTPATARAVRLRVGYVIQDGGLFPHLTARGNVTLMARHLGRDRAWIAGRVDELAGLTRFPADGLDRYPHQLSGGQRQRVGLMRALMLDPDALLLDEPLGALDPIVRADLQAELREVFAMLGKTVVLVTHDLGEAAFFADQVVLLRDGQIVQRGSPADLWQRPAEPFVTRFVQAQRWPEPPRPDASETRITEARP
jgi:osmoprotectant transport system ATP-binding protein